MVIAYLAVLTFVALRARAARRYSDFSIAGRRLPLALVFGSLAATYVGPGFSIAFVGEGFTRGFVFLLVGLAYAVQNVVVGLFVAPRLRAFDGCCTLGGVIGRKYNRTCQILTGVISVLVCTLLAAVMARAGQGVLTDTFGLPGWSSIVIVVGVTTLYTTFGGLRASVMTDAFQFCVFAVLLPVFFLIILFFRSDGGRLFGIEAVEATRQGFGSLSALHLTGLLTAFLLGETLIPPYANRALASKSTRVSRNGFLFAGAFSVVWFTTVVSLGIIARGLLAPGTEERFVLLDLVKLTMHDAGYALLVMVLVSVVMSSLDSLLNAGAVAFAEDIGKSVFLADDEAALKLGRIATIAIAAIAALATLFFHSIIDGLLSCYTIWASAVLPTLVLGLWLKRPQPRACVLSMTAGTVISIAGIIYLRTFYPKLDVQASVVIIPALAAALLAYAIGHFSAVNSSRVQE